MSKTKFARAIALEAAREIGERLKPFCERLTIAGSLRRGKAEVGDVELLFVSRTESRPDGLFERKNIDLALEEIDRLVAIGMLAKRPNINGHTCWGETNRLAVHVGTGVPVDLFRTTEPHWFVSLVIRTGPAEHNIRMITAAAERGLKLHAYASASGFTDRHGNEVPCTSEPDVFRLCGVPWREPKDRRA